MEALMLIICLFGLEGLHAAAPVWITPVADTNPVSKDENIGIGTSILDLEATDEDGDDLQYSIQSQPDGDHFELDGSTLQLKTALDYETDKSHDLVFRVSDGTDTVDSATFTVNVNDVNDVSPVFDPATYIANVQENSEEGISVLTVTASDGDVTDDYKAFTYSIQSGDDNNKFVLDESSGVLSTSANAISFSDGATISLVVAATDAADNDGTATVTIHVKTKPVFTSSTTASVAENSAADTSVHDVEVSDADGDVVTVEINDQTGGDNFKLSGTQLQVKDGASLDFESGITSYTISFRATDEDGNAVISDTVTVSVTNVNEKPVFDQETVNVVSEAGATPPQNVYTMGATDVDAGDTITYAISGGDSNSDFTINSGTGKLETANTIAYTNTPFNLLITATDTGDLVATGTVIVTMKTPPVLTVPAADDVTAVTVDEGLISGSNVIDLESTDADGDTPTYTIVRQTPNAPANAFDISETSLVTNMVFDYEAGPKTYELVIKVIDNSGLDLTSTGTFSVSIVNVNEHNPVFDPASYAKSIKEQTAVHSSFLQVAATDADSGDTITYSITGDAGPFDIDESTGYLSTNAAIVYSEASSYTLTVTASDSGGKTGTANVVVTVIEATTPVFTLPAEEGGATINIAEDTDLQTSIYTISATDDDGDTLQYVITQGTPTFSLNTNTRVVSVTSALDYDTDPKSYEIIFEARDQNSETSTATLIVSLTDVNDNAPVFDGTPYSAQARERLTSATQVFRVSATDADSSTADNNVIQYSITDGNTDNKFVIDASSGWISATNLDYATLNSYTLEVTAKDKNGAADALVTTVEVAIKVFTVAKWTKPPSQNTPVSIDETIGNGDHVYTLEAADADGDAVSFSLVSQSPDSDPKMFVLAGPQINTGTTDFNVDPEGADKTYTLNVRASSGGVDVDSSIVVTVNNVNDEEPVFSPTTYTTTLWEGEGIGTPVLTVTATDADSDPNFSTLTYTLLASGNDGNAFTMNGRQISVAAALDYATKSTYALTVQVSDTTFTDEATATINLFTKPKWKTPPALNTPVSIAENVGTESYVYTLLATDADGGAVTYSLLSPATDLFVLDGTQIKTGTTPLNVDQEDAVTSYTLNVRATAGDDSTDSSIVITITNVNDESPIFSPDSYTKSLWEGEAIGTSVLTVTATDADSDPNFNSITYTIESGNDDGAFTNVGSQINVAGPLDFTTKRTYTLTVRASDGSNLQDATITINLNTRPKFTLPPPGGAAKNVEENVDTTYKVYIIDVSDEDGESVDTTMSQSPGNKFVLTGNDVTLANGETLDYETISGPFTLSFSAIDDSGNSITSDDVVITVTDINDNTPTFTADLFSKTMKTTAPVGSSVTLIAATDVDGTAANNVITYSIHSGNTNTDFHIAPASGEVTTLNALTMTTPNYNLVIYAIDSGTPALTGSTTLTVTISEPTNPAFTKPAAGGDSVTIPEDKSINSVVYTLEASDADGDTLTYRIKSSTPKNPPFTISGAELRVASALDYETTESYSLTFEVDDADGDDTNKAASPVLSIDVTNVNEFTPAFNQTKYTKTVTSTIDSGDTVLTVTARDGDANAVITYSITAGNSDGYFTITSAGAIQTTEDWPVSSNKADLTVKASDGLLFSTAQVEIRYSGATRISLALITLFLSLGMYYLLTGS